MEIEQARTFLEVVSRGSFIAAAKRLNLTQTAVSARIRTLEDQLGRRLFVRNKAGAKLTAAGDLFQRDAVILVQAWERARQRVALPAGRQNSISVGGETSLWTPLLSDWLVWMRAQLGDVALRVEVDTPVQLLGRLRGGEIDLAVLYDPPSLPGLAADLVTEEKLVMVTTLPVTGLERNALAPENYVHVEWGATFNANFRAAFPDLANPAVSISLGPLALGYVVATGGTGYFRSSAVRPFLADGRLRRVERAPEFSFSVHAVYSTRSESDLLDQVRSGLRACAGSATRSTIQSRNG